MRQYVNYKKENNVGHICILNWYGLNWKATLRHCAVCLSAGIPQTPSCAVWSDESVRGNIHACVKGIPVSATQQTQSITSLIHLNNLSWRECDTDSSFAVLLGQENHTRTRPCFLKRTLCSQFSHPLSIRNPIVAKTILFLKHWLRAKFCPCSKSWI